MILVLILILAPKKPPNILGLVLEKGLAFLFFNFTIKIYLHLKGAEFLIGKKIMVLSLGTSHRLPSDLDQLATMIILENRVQNKSV